MTQFLTNKQRSLGTNLHQHPSSCSEGSINLKSGDIVYINLTYIAGTSDTCVGQKKKYSLRGVGHLVKTSTINI